MSDAHKVYRLTLRVEGLFAPHSIINTVVGLLSPAPHLRSSWTSLDIWIVGVGGWTGCLAIARSSALWTASQAGPSGLHGLVCPAAQATSAAVADLWHSAVRG